MQADRTAFTLTGTSLERHRSVIVLLVGGLSLCAACGRSNSQSAAINSSSDTSTAPSLVASETTSAKSVDRPTTTSSSTGPATHADTAHPAAANLPSTSTAVLEELDDRRFRRELAGELAHVAPDESQWQSEVFAENAAAQLTLLSAFLAENDPQAPLSLEVVTQDFRSDSLRPEAGIVFQDRSLLVQRWSADGGTIGVVDTPTLAADKLKSSLRGGIPHEATIRVQTKIVHVEFSGAAATTRILAEVSAESSDVDLQRNMTWLVTWDDPHAAKPRLTALRLIEFEEIRARRDEFAFTDIAPAVLQAETCYAQQLLPSVDEWRRQLDWRYGIDVIGPHGLAVGDANGDGLDDVYVCEPGGLPNRLLLQQPDGTAIDGAAAAGIDYLEPTQSALFVDLDNDGQQDLIVASGRYLLILSSDGRGHFQRKQIHQADSMIRSLSAADFDGNTFVDLYVCGYFSRNNSDGGIGLGRPLPYHDANNGVRNYLLANDGAWQFRDVTDEVGLDENNRRFSYACPGPTTTMTATSTYTLPTTLGGIICIATTTEDSKTWPRKLVWKTYLLACRPAGATTIATAGSTFM